jgi:SAM-dependent methyltransferase
MTDFRQRSTQAEWMDDPWVGFDDFRACLVDLARVNVLTLAHRPTLRFLDRLLPLGRALGRPIEIVDVGSGYGDLLRQIASWARRRRIDVSLTGVDLNPLARRAALEATAPGLGIQWVTADALAHDPPRGIDVVVSSLFTHHLTDARVVEFQPIQHGGGQASRRPCRHVDGIRRENIRRLVTQRLSRSFQRLGLGRIIRRRQLPRCSSPAMTAYS